MTQQETVSAAPLRAAAWMGGALLSFSAMAIAGREISAQLDTFQLMLFRSVIGLAVILMLAAFLPGGYRQFRSSRVGLHLVRNLFHFVGQFGWFYAVAAISLAEVFALEFTSPLWVAVLAPFFLGERLSRVRVLATLLGFLGVLIVVRPGMTALTDGSIAMLVGAVGFAGSVIATKRLASSETPLAILFYMVLIQAPLGLIPSLGHLVMPTPTTWFWLVVVSLCGLSAHFCMAQSFRLADATLVVPIDFLRLPLIALVGLVIYGEAIDIWILIGGVVILAGNYWNLKAGRG